MKRKWARRLIVSVLIAVLLMPTIGVLAIDPPDTTATINEIRVYRHCVETNDQLYLIEYTIPYLAPPTEPVNDAYIFRLMNGAVELKTSIAYAYNDKGYNLGLAAIYFTAAEVATLGLGWDGATTYNVNLLGNPLLTWTGAGCPSVDSFTFTAWNDPMGEELGKDVLAWAVQFTNIWGGNALFQVVSGNTTLSSYGEDYFGGTVPFLMTMSPEIFRSSTERLAFYDRTHTQAYAATLDHTFWVGTWLDLTDVATAANIPASFVYGGLWAVLVVIVIVAVMWMTGRFEGAVMASGLMLIFGALLHFIPLLIPIVLGAIMIIAALYSMFYKPSYG